MNRVSDVADISLAESSFFDQLSAMRDDDFNKMCSFFRLIGALLLAVGVLGVFFRISSNDGALAISGAVLLAATIVGQALCRNK